MMTRISVWTLSGILCLFFFGCQDQRDSTLFSPDHNICVFFEVTEGTPCYHVLYKDQEVIATSSLGFVLQHDDSLCSDFTIRDIHHTSFDETWEPVWGETSVIRNHYNEMKVELQERSKPCRQLHIVLRAYNDGIAFRYVFPEQDSLSDFVVINECTQFHLDKGDTAWWIPADYNSYEYLYRETPVGETQHVNTPVTLRTVDGCYLSIHEAALVDYPEMTLKRDSGSAVFTSELAPWADGTKAKLQTPCKTPWRSIQIVETPGELIESYLILNLNEPNVVEDVSWIQPMKYAGIWWGMHLGYHTWYMGKRHGATTLHAKRYIDFCAENNIPALLIEGWNTGWESWGKDDIFDYVTPYEDFDLEEVVRYGREKGVEIIGHHETGGQVPGYEHHLDSAFRLYHDLGIRAVKTGYAGRIRPEGENHHGQMMVRHHQKVIDKALENRIMIDAHEPIKPTGLRRTYPNFMTREGVRGMEYNAWSEGNPPDHTCILPFTRMLAGPIDYTPGILDIQYQAHAEELNRWHGHQDGNPKRVHTTVAKQLALYVVLYSPMQMLADLPENYQGEPALEFLKEVPVDWDDTRVLNGEIGRYVTIARRSGDNWFVGSITNEEPRELEVTLDFLDPNKEYLATIYADDKKTDLEQAPTIYRIKQFPVTSVQTLLIDMAAGGGQAIMIMSDD
jgi:alpha-glucosidase